MYGKLLRTLSFLQVFCLGIVTMITITLDPLLAPPEFKFDQNYSTSTGQCRRRPAPNQGWMDRTDCPTCCEIGKYRDPDLCTWCFCCPCTTWNEIVRSWFTPSAVDWPSAEDLKKHDRKCQRCREWEEYANSKEGMAKIKKDKSDWKCWIENHERHEKIAAQMRSEAIKESVPNSSLSSPEDKVRYDLMVKQLNSCQTSLPSCAYYGAPIENTLLVQCRSQPAAAKCASCKHLLIECGVLEAKARGAMR